MRKHKNAKEIMQQFALTDDEVRHSNEVAKYMYEHAKGDNEYKCKMYILGLLHEIGKITRNSDKAYSGALLLEECGFAYANEVSLLLKPDYMDESVELELLNEAEMHVSFKGDRISVDEKLKELETYYGGKTASYRRAEAVAKGLSREKVSIKKEYRELYRDFMQYKEDCLYRRLALDDNSDFEIRKDYQIQIKGHEAVFTFIYSENMGIVLSTLTFLSNDIIFEPYVLDIGLKCLRAVYLPYTQELIKKLKDDGPTIAEMLKFESSSYSHDVCVDFVSKETGKSFPYYTMLSGCKRYR